MKYRAKNNDPNKGIGIPGGVARDGAEIDVDKNTADMLRRRGFELVPVDEKPQPEPETAALKAPEEQAVSKRPRGRGRR